MKVETGCVDFKNHKFTYHIGGDKELTLTVSVGVATFPLHAQTAKELLDTAESAMYKANKAGRSRIRRP